jgi:mRNA-degrading endonuclease RelE of RelBE toxin-antitoxin system
MIKTSAFEEFYVTLSDKVQEKVDYVSNILIQNKVVSTKFVKKLENTEYYEMRISVGNEYRVILFTIDHSNLIEATQVLLLNGFIKKSTKDYKKQLEIADRIIQSLSKE